MSGSVATFLTEASSAEMQNISLLIEHANRIVYDYFGIASSFDILICRGNWEMEVQVAARKERSNPPLQAGIKLIGLTDYRLREIVIRFDAAKFGHYLHELIHSIISKSLPHQLREGLAWHFTYKLIEKQQRYAMAGPPGWVEELYVSPVRRLAEMVGDDFLRDLATEKATIEYALLPEEVADLFLPEEIFYAKKRHRK
jgi:hypothetical protein